MLGWTQRQQSELPIVSRFSPFLPIHLGPMFSSFDKYFFFSKVPSVIVTVLCDLGIKYLSKVFWTISLQFILLQVTHFWVKYDKPLLAWALYVRSLSVNECSPSFIYRVKICRCTMKSGWGQTTLERILRRSKDEDGIKWKSFENCSLNIRYCKL